MPAVRNPNARYWKSMRAAERKIIQYYLDEAGNVPDAAVLMEMDKAWLYRKLRALGIPKPEDAHAPKRAPKPKAKPKPPAPPPEDAVPIATDTADTTASQDLTPPLGTQLSLVQDPEQDTETDDADTFASTEHSEGAAPPQDAG